ncbi:MAG: tRNA pseudouridine(55) synthase TruB [Deltaproteobacteria bacterium]|nr:tRNA pseudouridine(55) synthase TruB [Deltaproteobacteria bacterium]
MLPGIYLVHKPKGPTSFEIVRGFGDEAAREALGGQKKLPLCHGGTLDPFAEGLLLLLVGQATRLMELLHAVPKVYVAQIAWGLETDTCNPFGVEVLRADATSLTPDALEQAIPAFLGWRDQVPPATSAKKIGGEPAYKKVMRGEHVELPPSKVYLHSARWLSHDLPRSSRLEIVCRGGYYVRALARDLGRTLRCGAHLSALARTAIGPWGDPAEGRVLVQGEGLLPWCRSRRLQASEAEDLRKGRPISLGEVRPADWAVPAGFPDPQGPIRALYEGRLVALLREAGEAGEAKLATFANLRGGL